MKKQKLYFLILLAAVIVLGAALLGVRRYNQIQEDKPEETEGIVIIDAAAEDVVKLSFDYQEEAIHLEKVEDTWYNAEDHSQAVKQNRPAAILSNVTPLVAQMTIEDVSDLSQYGLTEPSRVITFETAAESYIIYVGDKNDMTDAYYVSLPSDPNVYVVDSSVFSSFNTTWSSLLDTSQEESAVSEDTAE